MLGIFKTIEKEPDESQKVEQEVKVEPQLTQKELINDPKFKKLEEKFVKKGFTKRGIRELAHVTRIVYKDKNTAIKAAESILLGLKGEDGLGKILGTLKLATEGLGSILKGRKKQDSD